MNENLEYLYNRRERLDIERINLANILDKNLLAISSGVIVLLISFTQKLSSQLISGL